MTGNQCRDAKMGVMWLRFLELVSNLAAEFWTSWRREVAFLQRPEYKELQ